jgi:hypothetical protein
MAISAELMALMAGSFKELRENSIVKGHIIDINSVLSVTLGHGFTGPVIEHGFFGNKNAILADLSKQPGFDEGRPVYKNLKTRVDSMSGLIVGWYDDV